MKKYLMCALMAVFAFNAFAEQDKTKTKPDEEPDPNPVPIVSGDYGDPDKVRPRSLEPITCYVKGEEVVLNFMADLGEVEVVVSSLTTGEQWFACGDAAQGEIRVTASDEEGNYVVQIYAANGDAWYGCYTL